MKFIAIAAIFLFSCNNSTDKESSKENTTSKKPATEGCYWSTVERDSIVASLSQQGNTIYGTLSFDNFEKDGSTGPVQGNIEDDIIKLWYRFDSEGLRSIMQVWFKKDGDKLLRGIGPMTQNGDSTLFTDVTAITFSKAQPLQKIDCSEVPAKYK